MDKELVKYKKSLKIQLVINAVTAAIIAAFIVLSITEVITPVVLNERWADMWNGFICGVSTAGAAILVIGIIRNVRALKNEKALKQMYIKEHDERALEICHRSGHTSYWFDALGLMLGVIIGGFFSPVVSITCLGCLLYICIVRGVLKVYYSKKI